MSAKKGRPKKNAAKPSRRTSDELGWFPNWGRETRKDNFRKLLLEPQGEKLGGDIFGPLLMGDATTDARKLAGEFLCHVIEHGSIQAIDEVFRDIRKLKERADAMRNGGKAPRVAQAYHAYSAFIEETGREPTKKELRIYICERSERSKRADGLKRYKGFPPEDASDQWSPIWEDAGLKHLDNG